MICRWSLGLAVCVAMLPVCPLQAQGAGDFSRQPYVIQQLHRVIRFEADGTSRATFKMRVVIQTAAALRWFGQLTFPYSAENQRLEVDRVLVLKASGDSINVPASAILDLSGPIAQEAPMYSDLRQKVVTVPGVQPGDTLDYHVTWTTHTPFSPGNFWDAGQFTRAAIVLDERLTYDVPRRATVQIKTEGGPEPRITDAGERRTYEWRRANLAVDTTTQTASPRSRRPRHGVRLTTFRSWADVGAWYAGLERDRETVTPEIRQRAQNLVRGRTTLHDSISALYHYVATQFRYVSLQFGLGRYQPHQAGEVLANQYGDCKDKHVLLAALLRAIGVRTAPVLISSDEPIDPDVPSPQQFDHLITFVQAGADSLWLDATPGVAPFRFLLFNLRGKQSLVMPEAGGAVLVRTPDNPPFPTYTRIEATGTLSDAGRLNIGVRYETRGDVEVLLREVFRQVPEDSWRTVAQRFAQLSKLTGTVQSTTASDPIATLQPFLFTFQVEQPSALSWSNRTAEFTVPLTPLDLPAADDDSSATRDSLPIGILADQTYRLRVVLPTGVTVRLPAGVTLTRDYGTYTSSAHIRGDTLIVERALRLERRTLPPARATDLAAFQRVLEEDQNRTLTFTRATAVASPAGAATGNADDLHRVGMDALDAGDARGAIRAFRRVTELEPRHQYAWNNLGRAYLQLGKLDSAQLAFRKQVEVNPYDQYAHNNLGLALRRAGRREEAVAAFRKQVEVNPLDAYAHGNLGYLLVDMHRDSAAADALEHAVSITPNDTALHVLLGNAYLRLGRGPDAIAAFNRAVALSPTPDMWNNVAYAMAVERTELDTAEAYARRAIDATEGLLRDVTVEDAGMREHMATNRLGSYWDTLGWIYFGRGDLVKAERYVRAAWLLNFQGEIGEHLGQIEQRLGRTADAIHTYALALNAAMPTETTRSRLVKLLAGSNREADRRIELARTKLTTMRTVRLGKILAADVSGEVQLLFGPGPRVEGVHITSGPQQLQRLKNAIRAGKYLVSFPEAESVKLLRRGVVSCSSSGGCALVLMPAFTLRVPIERKR
jgi:Flp pilus assembly protein TadD/transglutaminase-like putative cysteine protease